MLRCFASLCPTLTHEYLPPTQPYSEKFSLTSSQRHADRRDWLTPKANAKTVEISTVRQFSPGSALFGPGFEPGLSVLDLLFRRAHPGSISWRRLQLVATLL
jgi:hypothetical protein